MRDNQRKFTWFYRELLEQHNSNTKAYRVLLAMWKNKQPIPGYENFPGWPELPQGWSLRNLSRLQVHKSNIETLIRKKK